MELTSFSDLKTLLELESDEAGDYPSLTLIGGGVNAAISDYTGRDFDIEERVAKIFISGSPSTMISLRALPLVSVASVVIESFGTSEELIEIFDFIITSYGLRLLRTFKNCLITVTYSGGIPNTTGLLRRAALLQTAYEYQNKEHIGASYVSTEGGSVTVPEISLLKEVKRVLNGELHPLKLS